MSPTSAAEARSASSRPNSSSPSSCSSIRIGETNPSQWLPSRSNRERYLGLDWLNPNAARRTTIAWWASPHAAPPLTRVPDSTVEPIDPAPARPQLYTAHGACYARPCEHDGCPTARRAGPGASDGPRAIRRPGRRGGCRRIGSSARLFRRSKREGSRPPSWRWGRRRAVRGAVPGRGPRRPRRGEGVSGSDG